jgi:hypothetical protein
MHKQFLSSANLHRVGIVCGMFGLIVGLTGCKSQSKVSPIAPAQQQGYNDMMKSGGIRPAGAPAMPGMPGGPGGTMPQRPAGLGAPGAPQ